MELVCAEIFRTVKDNETFQSPDTMGGKGAQEMTLQKPIISLSKPHISRPPNPISNPRATHIVLVIYPKLGIALGFYPLDFCTVHWNDNIPKHEP